MQNNGFSLLALLALAGALIGTSTEASDIPAQSSAASTRQIMVEVENSKGGGGGGQSLPLKAFAHNGCIYQSNGDKVLNNVVICDYTVDKNMKFIKANFVICVGSSPTPIRAILKLPILSIGSEPVKIPIGADFTAYAQLVD